MNARGGTFRLTVDSTTYLPVRLVYQNARGSDVTITFADRRLADGLRLPFRITTETGGRIVDELVFDRIAVNPELAKGGFK